MALRVYLASASPRRRELLRQIGVHFQVIEPNVDEGVRSGELPREYVTRLAREKAEAAAAIVRERRLAPQPIVAADTSVVVDGDILGKPGDRAESAAMLARLSGRTHEVLTAVCVLAEHPEIALSQSRVTFAELTADEIAAYWDTGEPRDKAGSYAIQGWGAQFVARLDGSYSGVMGLPLFEFTQLLKKMGLDRRE